MRTAPKHSVSYQLAEIIESRDLTPYAVARAAGVDPGVVSRFLNGKRGMTLDTLDKIAAALKLRLVEPARAPGRARKDKPAGKGDTTP